LHAQRRTYSVREEFELQGLPHAVPSPPTRVRVLALPKRGDPTLYPTRSPLPSHAAMGAKRRPGKRTSDPHRLKRGHRTANGERCTGSPAAMAQLALQHGDAGGHWARGSGSLRNS
jgi:hypothetical protein